MLKKESTIDRHMWKLRRECICQESDLLERQIAYAMEQALMWARTHNAGTLVDLAKHHTLLTRQSSGLKRSRG